MASESSSGPQGGQGSDLAKNLDFTLQVGPGNGVHCIKILSLAAMWGTKCEGESCQTQWGAGGAGGVVGGRG